MRDCNPRSDNAGILKATLDRTGPTTLDRGRRPTRPAGPSIDGEAFDVARLDGSRFSDPKIAALVRFERAGRRINVRGEDVDVDFTGILTLDPAGQCRFVGGEALYAEWEVRRTTAGDGQPLGNP